MTPATPRHRRVRQAMTWVLAVLLPVLVIAGIAIETGTLGTEGLGIAAHPYRGPVTDHFDGSRFHTVPPTPRNTMGDLLRWQMHRTPDGWIDQPALVPDVPPRVDGSRMVVTFINHASVLIQHRGLNILADPIYSEHAGPFGLFGPERHTPPGIAFDKLPRIDVIVLSHNHYDHFDMPTLKRLARRWPDAIVVSGLGNGAPLRAVGFHDVHEVDWWQQVPLRDDVAVTAVPMRHWTERMPWNVNATLWEGFVFTSPDGPFLFAGDTGAGGQFMQIRQRFGPMRFAALPIGAYAPRWFMKRSHMSAEEAVDAAQALDAQSVLGIHFGTFRLTDEGQFDPPRLFEQTVRRRGLPLASFRALAPGGQWDVPLQASGIARTVH
ncbi:MBL fold metallo-hydrolase [Robbsia andropogonis]|uniref:MBL fold metallo-hydrolase n=1 Tax=Robbsia andropogonis TaxID=28092 RepID=UPI002A6A77C1|nr:MBL fold metallo-hydrolase [Robbsia andropogonis]